MEIKINFMHNQELERYNEVFGREYQQGPELEYPYE